MILKVDGTEYKVEDLSKLSSYLKGEEGKEVTLTVKRGEEILDIKITRGAVHMNYVTSEMLNDNIGYIYIESFDEGCANDFKAEYNKLVSEGAKSLIIDLRDNGGGIVDEALFIADMICDNGETMLLSIDKDGKENLKKAQGKPEITMPIVVLTNENTASASEILVSALKENNKAEIVGKKTFGKGIIQELIPLSNGGALKVTYAEYYTPNRNKLNEIGIEPDYEVEFNVEALDVDEQLEKAIEVIKNK